MKKKTSVGAVLTEILNELEGGRQPSQALIKRGRTALNGVKKSIKAASEAARASGNSGRKPTYDREAIKAQIRDNPDKSLKAIADEVGCSPALVSILAKEIRGK